MRFGQRDYAMGSLKNMAVKMTTCWLKYIHVFWIFMTNLRKFDWHWTNYRGTWTQFWLRRPISQVYKHLLRRVELVLKATWSQLSFWPQNKLIHSSIHSSSHEMRVFMTVFMTAFMTAFMTVLSSSGSGQAPSLARLSLALSGSLRLLLCDFDSVTWAWS